MVKVFSRHVKKCLIAGSLALTSLSSSVTHASMGEDELKGLVFHQSAIVKQICKYLTLDDLKNLVLDDQNASPFLNKDWMNCFFSVK